MFPCFRDGSSLEEKTGSLLCLQFHVTEDTQGCTLGLLSKWTFPLVNYLLSRVQMGRTARTPSRRRKGYMLTQQHPPTPHLLPGGTGGGGCGLWAQQPWGPKLSLLLPNSDPGQGRSFVPVPTRIAAVAGGSVFWHHGQCWRTEP